MVARVRTVAFHGVEVIEVETQVTIASGLPAFTVVGLPDKAVAESRERVRAALGALGLALPPRRITVNLAPADVVKEGSHFDLPIALALLAAMDVLPADELGGYTVLGELSLDGSLTRVAGVLLAALAAASRGSGVICPAGCGGEAAWAGEIEVIAAPSLLAIVNHFKGRPSAPRRSPASCRRALGGAYLVDARARKAPNARLEIAAAGGHNLLMVGPPGSGKSMLAARLPGILPPLEPAEALELGMIQSVAGGCAAAAVARASVPRPASFRPRWRLSSAADRAPGRARFRWPIRACYFDELPEFNRAALEALRQPLETGRVTIARAQGHATFPARFQLIAAMNPCRCGHFAELACARAPRCAEDYQARLSGPVLDRIALRIDGPAVSPGDLALPPAAEGSAAVARRVATARARQASRYAGVPVQRAARHPHQRRGGRGSARRGRNAGSKRPRAADPCRRTTAFVRAGLSPGLARRPHLGRPRRLTQCGATARGGSVELSQGAGTRGRPCA
jgi:magnesium chelatase family protein